MDLQRLNRDELMYEMLVRGYPDVQAETVVSIRKELKRLMRDETFGLVFTHASFKADTLAEIDVCNVKVGELENYLSASTFASSNCSEARTVDTKLRHLLARLSRLSDSGDQAVRTSISNLVTRCKSIETAVDAIMNELADPSEGSQSAISHPSNATGQPIVSIRKQHSPVHTWNLKFTGSRSGMSVNAFVERVEEFRIARGVTEDELNHSIVDLLDGRALTWFRSVRSTFGSWREFIEGLRREFLPLDYEFELWKEIRARVQGVNERIGEFFSCMINLFNRLPTAPSEAEKLAILRRNIAPYFIRDLGVIEASGNEANTVGELLSILKGFESARDLSGAARLRTHSHGVTLLEPDLACTDFHEPYSAASRSRSSGSHGVHSTEHNRGSGKKCWNCEGVGHGFFECRKPKRGTFCFKCGRRGVTKNDCSCQRSKNGQAGRPHTDRK